MKTQETLRNTLATDRPFEIVVWIIGILVFVFFLISSSSCSPAVGIKAAMIENNDAAVKLIESAKIE